MFVLLQDLGLKNSFHYDILLYHHLINNNEEDITRGKLHLKKDLSIFLHFVSLIHNR